MALPAATAKTRQFLLLHTTYPEEDIYQEQSSVEDTTTSDSIIADQEICGILSSVTDEDIGKYTKNLTVLVPYMSKVDLTGERKKRSLNLTVLIGFKMKV